MDRKVWHYFDCSSRNRMYSFCMTSTSLIGSDYNLETIGFAKESAVILLYWCFISHMGYVQLLDTSSLKLH